MENTHRTLLAPRKTIFMVNMIGIEVTYMIEMV